MNTFVIQKITSNYFPRKGCCFFKVKGGKTLIRIRHHKDLVMMSTTVQKTMPNWFNFVQLWRVIACQNIALPGVEANFAKQTCTVSGRAPRPLPPGSALAAWAIGNAVQHVSAAGQAAWQEFQQKPSTVQTFTTTPEKNNVCMMFFRSLEHTRECILYCKRKCKWERWNDVTLTVVW
jgi:hypothetical protein